MPEGKENITIVNIVVNSDLKVEVPLEKMAVKLPYTEYNPEVFPGLVLKIKEPRTTGLIFSSGKIVCTGAKSMEKVREAVQRIIEAVEKVGVKVKVDPEIKVQNMVASGNIGMHLNLNHLALVLENVEYEPEQFPGLVYKLRGAKATFLLFSNGKIVVTGTKSEEEVHESVKLLKEILKRALKKK